MAELSSPTRRSLLLGAGAVVALAATGATLLSTRKAEAGMPLQSFPEDAPDEWVYDDEGGDGVQLAQSNRWRRRALARRCRNDRRFRRRNQRLCRRVTGRIGRPGSCIQIGAVTICE